MRIGAFLLAVVLLLPVAARGEDVTEVPEGVSSEAVKAFKPRPGAGRPLPRGVQQPGLLLPQDGQIDYHDMPWGSGAVLRSSPPVG